MFPFIWTRQEIKAFEADQKLVRREHWRALQKQRQKEVSKHISSEVCMDPWVAHKQLDDSQNY